MAEQEAVEVYTPEEEADFNARVDRVAHEIVELLEAEGRLRPYQDEGNEPATKKRTDLVGRIGDIIEDEFAVKEFPESEEGDN